MAIDRNASDRVAVMMSATASAILASGAEGVRLVLDALGISVIAIGAATALAGIVRARLRGERVRFNAVRLTLSRYSGAWSGVSTGG